MDKIKTKAGEQVGKTQKCKCKNSCQKKTGPKRAGCPCKDEGLYCSEQCQCGTNIIVCRNNEHDQRQKRTDVGSDHLSHRKSSTYSDLVSGMENLVVDDFDGNISDEHSATSDYVTQDAASIPAKGSKEKTKSRTQKSSSQSLLQRVHKINNGYALVIHNRYFNNLRPREGSEKDLNAIKFFCKEAGLTIDIQENLKINEIRHHCRKLTEDENKFKNHDGFVCFILSHGNSSGIRGTYNDTISVQEIVTYFNESNDLMGKPKLFFIQACRAGGMIQDDGNETDTKNALCPPESSDILIAHSTIEGKLSYRDIRTGSWFIQTLMNQLKAHAQSLHLMDIMTWVNEDMAGSELEGYRQMPIQVTTLTKFVYFKMATVDKVMARNANMTTLSGQDDDASSCATM